MNGFPPHPDQAEFPAPGQRRISAAARLGFSLLGAVTTIVASLVLATLLIYFLAYVGFLGWIPFCVAGLTTALAARRNPKVRWYGIGLIAGSAIYLPYAINLLT